MSYSKTIVLTTAGAPEIVNGIKSVITQADSGWTNPSSDGINYQSVSGGVTYTCAFPSATMAAGSKLDIVLQGVSVCLMSGNSTLAGSYIGLEVSAAPDFLYIRLQGPSNTTPGAADATYGSPNTSIMLTQMLPYNTLDTRTASELVCVVAALPNSAAGTSNYNPASNPTTNHTSKIIIKKGASGSTNQLCELAALRPAVQDIVSLGDLFDGKALAGGIGYSAFVVVEPYPSGWTGRLKNVFFGGDNYTLGSESTNQLHADQNVTVGGLNYTLTNPGYFPSSVGAQGYTPFGTCLNTSATPSGVTTSVWSSVAGPNIIIKKGSGA